MHELLDGAVGEPMELAAYQAAYERDFWNTDNLGFWKLERQQFFQEPGYDSWEAFARGDWQESLRLLEEGATDMDAYYRKIAEHGFATRRVRVIEEPITTYLQWELQVLRMRNRFGGSVRVVGPAQVTPLEATGPLPEIYTLGGGVMYEAVYDQRGILEAARRYTDRELVLRCQRFIADLYAVGEPLEDYFARRVAALPAPGPQRVL